MAICLYDQIMLKRLSLTLALLIPTVALALDIQPGSPYIDVKASSKEAPAVNLLTRAGVVQGIGNSRFGPSRLVNRAEFLKIAMAAHSIEGEMMANDASCFPDVVQGQWFAIPICKAFAENVVQGFPDGLFHPERTVQYDEALKMLTLIYGYEIPLMAGQDWVEPYYQSAVARGVDLPIRIRFATPLTRAYAARLIAAFKAENEGELQNLRFAEAGRFDLITDVSSSSSSASSLSSSSSVSSSLSSSAVSSSSSVSTPTALFILPPVSHFLLVGQASDAIASITVPPQSESVKVASVEVKLFSEVRSLKNLELVTTDGTVLATLLRRITSDTADYKLTFTAEVPLRDQKILAKDIPHTLALRATLLDTANGGFSEELLQVRTINLALQGETTNTTQNIPALGAFPKHQTSFSRVTKVTRTSPATSSFQSGRSVLLNSFQIQAETIAGKSAKLNQLVFSFQKTGSFAMSNVRLTSGPASVSCSMNTSENTLSCVGLALSFGDIPPTGIDLSLYADIVVSTPETNASFQADLPFAGSTESLGSLYWTDGAGQFRWIEGVSPIATGTLLQ